MNQNPANEGGYKAIDADVAIVGAGLTGCSAAMSAAGDGAHVVLVERGGLLGGLATNGLHSLFQSQKMDQHGNQQFSAASVEILKRVLDGQSQDVDSPPWCGIIFDEQKMKLVLAELMKESGVRVMSHAFSSDIDVLDGQVCGLVVEDKTGRQQIRTRAIVDATGTAVVADRAGCRMETGTPTVALGFKLGNVDVDGYLDSQAGSDDSEVDRMHKAWSKDGILCQEIRLPTVNVEASARLSVYGLRGRNELIVHRTPVSIDSADPVSVTSEQIRQQLESYQILGQMRALLPGFATARLIHNASMMEVRGARAIVSQAADWWKNAGRKKEKNNPGPAIDVINARCGVGKPESLGHELAVPHSVLWPKGPKGLYVANPKALSMLCDGLLSSHDIAVSLGRAAGIAAAAFAGVGTE